MSGAIPVCHFFVGMPAYRRAEVLGWVADWVACAWVLRVPFAVVLGTHGVVRVCSRAWSESDFRRAYEGAGLIGVFMPDSALFADLGVQGAVDVVMSDVSFALEEMGL